MNGGWINSADTIPRNPYCFRAYASGTTTLTDNTPTKILFATEDYDYNNNFASSTYTAPVAGVYHFACAFELGTVSTGVLGFARIMVGGVTVAFDGTSVIPITSGRYSAAGDILLAAGDTVEAWGFQNSAGNEDTITGTASTWFSGHLVHRTA